MEMTKISKEEKLIRDIHRQLFKETMPIANYDDLIKDEKTNFKSYIISMWTYHNIVEETLKGKKLTDLKKAVIRNILNSSKTLPDIKRL
jgi:hypothetical protein